MFLSWWRNLVQSAYPQGHKSKKAKRFRIPAKFCAALRVEQLEDRIVPIGGQANVFLNLQNALTQLNTITAARSTTVPVYIDFNNSANPGTVGGVGGGTFYVQYDPNVLSISETATSVTPDIKLGSLLTGLPNNYSLSPAAGFSTGVVAIGLTHSGTTFLNNSVAGHLVELDFHVVSSTAIGSSTLLDLQSFYLDTAGNLHQTVIHEGGSGSGSGSSYFLTPPPNTYPGTLTQPGALSPNSVVNPFSPDDADTTDAAIQIVAKPPNLAPTAVSDTFSMAPNNPNFSPTMTITGLANGVLANDTPTSNGPMSAVLTGTGITTTSVPPSSASINTVTENGFTVTVTTAGSNTYQVGEEVTLSGVSFGGYNGTFLVSSVAGTQFTYQLTTAGLIAANGGQVDNAAQTLYSQNTVHGKVTLNGGDGSVAFTAGAGYTGTDSFTYQAVDAFSNTPSAPATANIYVGGYLSIPQNLTAGSLGSKVVVPVNILNPNPANSGGLDDVTIGINYDPAVFSIVNITEGVVNTNAGWGSFTANTTVPGAIIITSSATGGAAPITSTTGGSLALITFNVIGFPSSGGSTSVINLAAVNPQITELDVADTGTPTRLPFAIAPVDNTNFNGTPGQTDGLVTLNPILNTSTTISASVGGSSVSTVTYGTLVTLMATISPSAGSHPPTAGSVDFKDGNNDLGTITTDTVSGNKAVFTLITTANQLQVIGSNGGTHTITAAYTAGPGFNPSAGTLVGGLTVTQANLTITAKTNTKTYDSTTSAAATPTVTGLIGSDTVTGLAEVYANAAAGSSKTLSVSAYTVNDGNNGNDYAVTTVTNTTGLINQATLTITATTNTKSYDSTTTANATPTVSGLIGGDTVTGLTEVYTNANAGSGKTLSVSAYTINDSNSGNNYVVTTVTNTTGLINKASLTITALTNTKTYDATTTATATPTVSGLIGGDTVTGLAEVYTNANAGSGKTLSVSAYTVNDSNTGNNYTVTTVTNTTGLINKATLTITATTNTKTYDSTTTAATAPTVSGLQGGDTVTGLVEVYTSSTAGSGKTLSVSAYTVNDANSGNNYAVTTVTNTTGVINKASLTITALTNTKAYDSTTSAGAVPTVSGLIGGDTVTGMAEVYSSSAAGSGKTLSVNAYTVNDSNSGNNYAVTTVTNTTGLINKATLTITALTNTKAYDSTTSAGAAPTVSGLIGGDTVTGLAEVFSSSAAGSGKTLSVSAYTINDNNSGNNYAVTTVTNTTGLINKATLTITALTNTKTYDSTVTAAATPTVSGLIGSDTVTGLAEVYTNANAGAGKTLSVSAYTVNDANSGNNYAVTTVANTTGLINKASLTITATTNTKAYDSTTSATAVPTVSGLIGSDTVTGLAEVYTNANAGAGKTLSVSAYTVNDANSGNNYAVTTVTNTTGLINKASLTITALTNTKGYDSTTSAGAAPTVSGLIGGDTVTGLAEVFSSSAAGSGKTLSVSAYTINDNNSGNNYAVTTVTNTTGLINKATLTITATTNTKTYDSTTTAVATPTVSGLIGGDTVTGLAEVYTNANAGAGKTLSVNAYTVNDSNSGNNYAVTTVTNTSGLINKASLTITATTNTKTYDSSTTAASTPTVSGLFGGDTVTGLAEVYTNANAGAGKTLSVNAYTINDSNSGNNYVVTTVTNTTGLINKAGLTITALTNTKTYDSTATAAATPTVSGLIGSDTVTGLAEVYTNANAGAGKTLSVNAYTINDSNSGNNYAVTTVTNTTGLINKAGLTITALTNTKNFDGNVSAAAMPTVSGLIGNDTVTGLAEVYSDPVAGTGKTLSVSAYTVNDGNSGNNYAVTKAFDTSGVIIQGTVATTTTLQTSQASVVYGTPVTFTITVTAVTGINGPPTGTVEVFDNTNHDLGTASPQTSSGQVSTYTLTTLPKSLNVAAPTTHTITANYFATGVFVGSTGTLAGGQTVTAKALTITATTNTKTYDATTTAGAAPTVAGLVTGDTVTGLVEVYTNANAGSGKTLSISAYTVNDGNSGNNYTVTTAGNTTGVINKATLTITASTNTKTYDSTTTAATAPTVSGLQGGDTVTGLVEVYTSSTAGSGKTLSVSAYTVNDSTSGNNYAVTTVTNTTGLINKAGLTITALTNTKTYDATTTAAATPTVTGLIGGDTVTGLAEVYTNANAGSGKTLSVSAYTVNDANSGNNYNVTTVTNTTGLINKATLTITAITNTKTYDSTTTAAATPTVSGLIGGDTVTGLSEVYTNANAGAGKTLSVNAYTVNDSNSGNNYAVTTVTNTTGLINKATLTITATTNTKTYDSTTTAATAPTVSGLQGGDTVTGLVEVYTSSTAGSGKTLSVSAYTVNDSTSGNNYAVTTVTNTTGVINKAGLTITALTNTKTYDATATAAATPTVSGLIGGDTVTGLAEVYSNSAAGSGKTLSVSAYTVNDANSGNNYAVTTVTNSTGLINKTSLTITAVTNTKTYDSTTTAAATPTVAGLIGGDTVTGLAEVYTNANAGAGKTLSVSAFTVNDSNSGNNYAVTTVTNTSGLINKASLTITATTNTKTYDSTTTAASTPTVSGLFGGDTVTGLAEVYTNANAGAGKTLSVNAYTINDSNSGNNYVVTTVTNTTGLINKAGLTITALTNTKTYDSTATAAATPTVSGLIGSDTVTGLAEVYTNANAGAGKTLSVNAYTINDSNSGNNYAVTTVTNTTGLINKAGLTITALTNTKNFDGNVSAAAMPTVSGLIGNDTVTGLAEVYSDPVAGTGKTLSVSAYTVNDGNSGNNYAVTKAFDTSGVIIQGTVATTTTLQTSQASVVYGTPVTFTITVTAITGINGPPTGTVEVFDNTNHDLGTASPQTSSGQVSTYTLTTLPKSLNVAAPTTHTITANYFATGVFVGSTGTLAGGQTVTAKALTITATTNTKTYDATTTAGAAPTVAGLVTGDTVTGLVEVYTNANAGSGKTLSISAYTVNDGNSGNNYTVTTAGNTTGVINKATLTITATTNTKTYDSTTTAATAPTVSGLQGGDTVTGLVEVYTSSTAGSGKTLSVSAYTVNDANSGNNYNVTTVSNTTGVINKAGLTITALTNTKTYDSTNTAAATPTVSGLIGGDTVTGLVEVYTSSAAGSGKTLSVSAYTINDANSGNNYAVTTVTNTMGLINKATLTITALTNTKIYDSTTSAAATPTVSGLAGGDTVTGRTEVYSSFTAGSGKTLSVSAYTVTDGNSGNNYNVTTVTNTTGLINKAILTITALTNTKTYDSTTSAAATPTVSGLVGGDTVTGLAEVYASASAGAGKTLSVSAFTVNDSNSGNNYAVTTVTNTTGLINKATLTITALTKTKTYDSTTMAAATPTVSGLIGGDTVTGLAEVFSNANAGSSKTLSVSAYTINDSNSGNNYTVSTVANTTGLINKVTLTITATTNTKTYDATTTATAAPSVSGLVGGDTVTGLAEVYTNVNAGSAKTLSVSVYTINDNNSGNNYTVTTVTNTTGVINKAALTITALTNTKNYDATTTAVAVPTVSGLAGGDTVTGLTEVYDTPNLGTGKTLSVSAYTVGDGNSGNNYTVTIANSNTGAIVVGPFSKYIVTIVGSSTIVAGHGFLFKVQATDAFGNPVNNYTGPGTVTTTTNPVDSMGNFPVSGSMLGVGVGFFQGNLKTAGSYTLTTSASGFTGTSAPISIIPDAADHFTVTGPNSALTGVPINITASAFDHYNNLATGYTGTVKLTSTDGAAILGSPYTFTTGPGTDNGSHNFSVKLFTPGSQTVTVTDTVSTNPIVTGTSGAILTSGLIVTSFTPTPTGFTAAFNRPFIPSDLTMYGLNLTTIQDVTLRGAHVGPIHGTLLLDPSNQSITFNATTSYLQLLNNVYDKTASAALPDDTYTATLVSGKGGGAGSNGFIDNLGEHLDGAGNGGHANYVSVWATSYQHNATPALGIPDFARGPDNSTPIKVFNDTAAGIPITLYHAANVTDVTFTLTYNQAVLNITGTLQGANSDATDPNNGTFTLLGISPGVATFNFHDATAQSGTVVLGDIVAVVPNSAVNQYQAKGLLQLGSIVINHGAVTGAVGANSIQINSYLDDVNGDGIINGMDTLTANQVAIGMASGFDAFRMADPVIVGDSTHDFFVDAGNVSAINLFVAHLNPPQIPMPPTQLQPGDVNYIDPNSLVSPNAADPTLSLGEPMGVSPRVNEQVISVLLDHPHPAGSTGMTEATLALTYDPALLSISPTDITLGSIPNMGTGWQLSSVVDATTGQIGIDLYSLTPITATAAGSLVNIAFHVLPGVSSPITTLQLVNAATPDGQTFGTIVADAQGSLILSPGLNRLQVETPGGTLPHLVDMLTRTGESTQETGVLETLSPGHPEENVKLGISDSHSPGHSAETSNEESALVGINNGSGAVETPNTHPLPGGLIVTGMSAMQPNMAGVQLFGQALQISNAFQMNAVPAGNSLPQLVDRLFLGQAGRPYASPDIDWLSQFSNSLMGEAFPGVDGLICPIQTSAPEISIVTAAENADRLETFRADHISLLDKVFSDLGAEMDDFGDFGD